MSLTISHAPQKDRNSLSKLAGNLLIFIANADWRRMSLQGLSHPAFEGSHLLLGEGVGLGHHGYDVDLVVHCPHEGNVQGLHPAAKGWDQKGIVSLPE